MTDAVFVLQARGDSDEFGRLHVEHGFRPRVESFRHALPARQHDARSAERRRAQQLREQRHPVPVAAAELHDRVRAVGDHETGRGYRRQVQAPALVIGEEYSVDVLAQERDLGGNRLGVRFGPEEQLGR